jgi:ubiquinone/menaquinone biosynthesis C-methylase UbiE
MNLLSKREEWENDYKKSSEEIDYFESEFYEEVKESIGPTLDVGCGTLRGFLELKGDSYSVGLDFSKEALKIAKENRDKKEKKQQIDLVCACAEFLPFRNESFDTVICIETLVHAEDTYRKILEESKRVSKRKLILTVDHKDEPYEFFRTYGIKFTIKDNVFIFHDQGYRSLAFDETSIAKFLKKMDLKILRLAVNETDYNKDQRLTKIFGHLPLKKSKSSIFVECEKRTD